MSQKTILAAFLDSVEHMTLRETSSIQPGDDEVLIQPIFTAICGSDVSFFKGHRTPAKYPMVLGHELVGNVLKVGLAVKSINIGQRVVVEPNYPCGVCKFCRTGRGNICPNKKSLGVTIPGCFAGQFVAPAEYCWVIPESIDDYEAVVIEPLAVSMHALWQSEVQIGDSIAVIGCGSTGLLLIHAAVAQGVKVLAYDKYTEKMEMAVKLGAEAYGSDDLIALWEKENVTSIFECAGSSATVEMALDAAPRGSQIILMGLSASKASFQPLRFVREGLEIKGSLIYDHPSDFAKTIELVKTGILSPKMIISQEMSFSEINEALVLASSGKKSKIIIAMKK
jgi:L-iditol 2-dehydrogenase/L-gulonate 5-dehydrogenase